MALEQRYELGGLNTRTHELLKKPGSSTDLQNCELNHRKVLVKRNGFKKVVNDTDGKDLYVYRYRNEVISPKSTKLRKLVASSFVDINNGGGDFNITGKLDFAEYGRSLYFTDPSFNMDMMKYDGYMGYQAGVPSIPLAITKPAAGSITGTYYFRSYIRFTDGNGDYFYSDYYQSDAISFSSQNIKFEINTILKYNTDNSTKFYSKYCYPIQSVIGPSYLRQSVITSAVISIGSPASITVAAGLFPAGAFKIGTKVTFSTTGALPTGIVAGTPYYVASGTDEVFAITTTYADAIGAGVNIINTSGSQSGVHTITFLENVINITSASSTNLIAGDYYYTSYQDLASSIYYSVPLKVISVSSSEVIFDVSSIGSNLLSPSKGNCSYDVFIFKSLNLNYGYELVGSFKLDNTGSNTVSETLASMPATNIMMADNYDSTIAKLLPFKCKYISCFRNNLILANYKDESLVSGETTQYKQTIFWSNSLNPSSGDTVESFSSFNSIEIGETDEGDITGISADSDKVLIFKQRAVYCMMGDLTSGNIRVFRIMSQIGSTSFKSLFKFEQMCWFMSQRGIFETRSTALPTEISDAIERIFTDNVYGLDYTKAQSALDILNERLMVYIPHFTDPTKDQVFVYKYSYKMWFRYYGIPAKIGFVYKSPDPATVSDIGHIYYHDGSALYVENSEEYDSVTNSHKYSDELLVGGYVPINTYYKTMWEHVNAPSLKKKFVNLKVFSFDNVDDQTQSNWVLTIKTNQDWNTTTIDDGAITFDQANRTGLLNVNSNLCHAMRFELSNNVVDEDFVINAIEFEVAHTQQRMRD